MNKEIIEKLLKCYFRVNYYQESIRYKILMKKFNVKYK